MSTPKSTAKALHTVASAIFLLLSLHVIFKKETEKEPGCHETVSCCLVILYLQDARTGWHQKKNKPPSSLLSSPKSDNLQYPASCRNIKWERDEAVFRRKNLEQFLARGRI